MRKKQSATKPTSAPKLTSYRTKRRAEATGEPFGGGASRPGAFVVHLHAARRMHYDLRLEMGGVLVSWAVPRGPSSDPNVRRLAVHVEDHPIEYVDFEGVIPAGNYGGGNMIAWDWGRWEPHGDPIEGLHKGKLLFDMHGFKLKGMFTLFRTAGSEKEWLLVKKPDAYANEAEYPPHSVYSGLRVDAVDKPQLITQAIEKVLRGAGAKSGAPMYDAKMLMHPKRVEHPFSRKDWGFELKYDGFRLIAERSNSRIRLYYRSGREATDRYPEICRALRVVPGASFMIDGEVVIMGANGRPNFNALLERAGVRDRAALERTIVKAPATFFVFDLMAFNGLDARPTSLKDRKRALAAWLPALGIIRVVDHVLERGDDMHAAIETLGLEGWVAKDMKSSYIAGRSERWLKHSMRRSEKVVILGFTPATDGVGFGALIVARPVGTGVVFAGRVGTGFNAKVQKTVGAAMAKLKQKVPSLPVAEKIKGAVWIKPQLQCEIRFREVTADGAFRHPSFVRLCDELWAPAETRPAAEPRQAFAITNPDKLFWPEEGYTKRDLVEYYERIAPWMLPFLHNRPIVLTRYPDGIHGKSFFQKDAPAFTPTWVHRERMWSQHAQREIDYFVCNDVETLKYVANLATIPLHIWSSRLDALDRPDWCVIDLDPKGAPWEHVVTLAKRTHALCEEIGMPAYVKSTGSSGLHVLIPLARAFDHEHARSFSELIAQRLVREFPDIATTERPLRLRRGRVYVDCLQNGHGRLIVAPYAVRPLPGAPVSAPLHWREVTPRITAQHFTILSIFSRLKKQRRDPFANLLTDTPSLAEAVAAASKRWRWR